MRLQDNGVEVGPYRVFQSNALYPGIAMSRSIGDYLGKDIGIIAEPIVTTHTHSLTSDKFIVLASDGVWDVMEN
jgi:serine/threonine protein phosphatase PrpC